MASFEFSSQIIELEICGKKYEVKYDNNTRELCKDIQKKAGEMTKKVCADENAISDDEVCAFFIENIDKILGKGSSTTIFMGRKVNFLDAAQLFNFILKELTVNSVKGLGLPGLSE